MCNHKNSAATTKSKTAAASDGHPDGEGAPSTDDDTTQARRTAAEAHTTIEADNSDGVKAACETPASTSIDVGRLSNGHKTTPPDSDDKKQQSCLGRVSAWATRTLEDTFERHGRRVASHSRTTAVLCLVGSALLALGSLNFTTELRPYRLWIPQDSEFIKVMNWQAENFPSEYRRHVVVWEAENVLTARSVKEMWRLHTRVRDLSVGPNGTSWDSLCARVPSLPMEEENPQDIDYDEFDYGTLVFRRRRDLFQDPEEDLSLMLPRDQYCNSLSSLPKVCLETSLLEIWGLNEDLIMSLTDEQVLEDINSARLSEVFGYKVNFTNYLGSVTYNESGEVVGAKAATHIWVSLVDTLAVGLGDSIVDQGSGDLVDTAGFAWENAWVATVLNDSSRPRDIRVYAHAASSFGTVSDDNIWGDVKWLVVGFSLMSIFVNVTLGRRNLVQQRPMLAFLGMVSVGQAVAVSYGVCSLFGVPYCPVNSILPILLMGLGVDDMFVIIAAWEAAGRHKASSGCLVERAGRTMRHAGVAITVTSLTDVTAFAVGASTDLPALRSFCLYAAVGILAVYVMQATFFLAWLVRDEKRMEENKNGFLWCVTHRDWKPSRCSDRDLMADAFKHGFCRFILSAPVRVFILIGSGCLLASSAWATMNLHQEFNPMWFIPRSSYLYEAFEASSKYFPEAGERGYVYFANISLPDDLPKLNRFANALTANHVVSSVDAWFTALDDYISQKPELDNTTLTYSMLQDTLSVFLQSSSGAAYRSDFIIDGDLDCHYPAPPITSFRIGITHRPAKSPAEQSAALKTVKSLVASIPVQGYKAAWAQAYSIWETNEVIGYELWRNIILAGLVVGLVTLVLLASFVGAMLVLGCVGATLVGISGSMWLWGLTVDTVSCIALVLAIGLSVDYAAHVAHAFLAARDVKDTTERARVALETVGPAVLQGGLSTLLSFVLLAGSSSHVFMTFFKVFTAASVLGLYYGLVLLPVVLSLTGPDAYDDFQTSTPPLQADPGNVGMSQHPQAYTNSAFSPEQDITTKEVSLP